MILWNEGVELLRILVVILAGCAWHRPGRATTCRGRIKRHHRFEFVTDRISGSLPFHYRFITVSLICLFKRVVIKNNWLHGHFCVVTMYRDRFTNRGYTNARGVIITWSFIYQVCSPYFNHHFSGFCWIYIRYFHKSFGFVIIRS